MKFRIDLRLVKAVSIMGTLGGLFFLATGKWIGAICMLLGSYQFEKNLYRCPHCGRPMSMNLRADDTFVEDVGWHTAADRYSEFLRRHEGQRILFLELGVGYNTPVIIKYPFWRMTAKNPNAFYACINQGQSVCPPEIERQSVCIHADIGAIIAQL